MAYTRDAAGVLTVDGISLAELVLTAGTPAYVYDLDAIARGANSLETAFGGRDHLVAYAVKANSAGGVVRTLAAQGCGADVVSAAELLVATACGISPERIVFSGVAKSDDELDRALQCAGTGIAAIQVESFEEIARVEARALAAGRVARVGIRVNPSVDLAGATHANIATGHDAAKFGVPRVDAMRAAERIAASPQLVLVGLATHAGSQFTSVEPYIQAARVLLELVRSVRASGCAPALRYVDTGGGFGIDYGEEGPSAGDAAKIRASPPAPSDFVRAALAEQRAAGLEDLALYVEPGRCLVGPHGVLIARCVQRKVTSAGRWLMIDAGMNDLLRPALYQARHRIVAIDGGGDGEVVPWRVVGPVCESSDDFGMHMLPRDPPRAVAILDAGAYGYTMASEYNGRQLPAEVFVSVRAVTAITARGSIEEWARRRAAAGG